jgi:hypothetical protein
MCSLNPRLILVNDLANERRKHYYLPVLIVDNETPKQAIHIIPYMLAP